ncbi:non-homologous end-joining factor 1 [Xylocopa sonorina]|uniref:non-homologous end-joining factor 1 n=1 Tax=Xylocopa sonorina TaxID=1818115 RepID=UPI00403AA387
MNTNRYNQDVIWNNVIINNDAYLISIMQRDNGIQILLTNLVELWMETLTNEIILDRCQKLNPLLNVEAINYNEIVLNVLNNISKYIVEASVERIELSTEIEGGLMKFTLNLSKGTAEDFWNIITKPLCVSGNEIIRQRQLLLDLIKKKDDEIAEYKAGGAELLRKHIETKTFTEEQFKTDNPTANTIECTNAFQGLVNFYNEFNLCKWNASSRCKFLKLCVHCSCDNRRDDVHRTNQSTIKDIQGNNKRIGNNEDISLGTSTNVINAKTNLRKKGSPKRKVAINKTGTANMEYKPIKKLKKGLTNFIL